mgnify:FL=1
MCSSDLAIAASVVITIVFALSLYGTIKSQRKQYETLQTRIEKLEQDSSKDEAIRKLGTEVVELQTRLDRQTSALRNTLISLDRFMTAQAAAAKPAVHTNAPVAVKAPVKVPAKTSKRR